MNVLHLSVVAAVAVAGFARVSAAESGVSMRFYRNLFSGSMAELKEMDFQDLKADREAVLPTFELKDPWALKQKTDISRRYGAIIDGLVTPPKDGAYRFLVPAAGGRSEIFFAPDGNPAHARRLKMAKCEVGNPAAAAKKAKKGKPQAMEKYLASGAIPLKAGKPCYVKAFFLPGWKDHFSISWAADADGELEREDIPAEALAPMPAHANAKPRLTVGNARLTEVHPDDDEPDSLCWDRFADEIPFIEHFYAWAKTHPLNLSTPQPLNSSTSYPYVWLKMPEVDLVTNDGVWSNTNAVNGTGVLKGPRSHNICSFCHFDATVPVEGTYRLWCRYWRKSAKSSNTFNLSVTPMPSDKPAEDDIDTVLTKFQQTFARSRSHNERCGDPTPEIMTVEPGPDGWGWESSHRTAHLRPGKYRFAFKTGQYPGHDGVYLSDIVLTADPMLDPGSQAMPAKSGTGTFAASAGVRNPLYAVRPGADLAKAPAARLAWWRQWRDALYDKLCDAEHTDYVWGYLATLNCFDEDSNLIGRIREVRTQKSVDARPSTVVKLTGSDFANVNGWGESGHMVKSYSQRNNISHDGKTNESTYAEIEIPRAGRYQLKVRYYGWNGASRAAVEIGGRDCGGVLVGVEGGANNWAMSDVLELPAGKGRVTLTTCYNPKHGGKPAPKSYNTTCVTRVILTERIDLGVDNAEVQYPDGKTIGKGDLGFWCQDPFNAFSRFSQPAIWSWNQFGPDHWTPLASEEIGKTQHAVEAISGEVKSQLLLIRNNTDKPAVISPKIVSAALPANVRLVAYTVTSGGMWSPQILMKRTEVVCPPRQNTALWVSIDCRGAKEGSYPVSLAFADKKVTWNVTVKGSFAGVPDPYLYPYARPYPRESCWALYKEYGLNTISYVPLSRKAMDDYGIRLLIGISTDGLKFSAESVRKAIDKANSLGQKPGDYTWYLIDEPPPKRVPQWMEMAKTVKDIDKNQLLWCNLGFGALGPQLWDLYFPMMELWDVSCPFKDHFSHDEKYRPYYEKLQRTGKIKLVYHTLDIGPTEKKLSAPLDLLNLAKLAADEGRDGYANFSLMNGNPYDDLYMGNQDLAVSIYPGSQGRTLATRNLEAFREGGYRWRRAKMQKEAK